MKTSSSTALEWLGDVPVMVGVEVLLGIGGVVVFLGGGLIMEEIGLTISLAGTGSGVMIGGEEEVAEEEGKVIMELVVGVIGISGAPQASWYSSSSASSLASLLMP